MNISLSKKEKYFIFSAVFVAIIFGSVYFGEAYRPFGIAADVVQYAGKKIKEEKPAPRPHPKGKTYIVRKGDTVWKISKKFGVHPEEIKFLNELPNDGKIVVGQRLVIPDKG